MLAVEEGRGGSRVGSREGSQELARSSFNVFAAMISLSACPARLPLPSISFQATSYKRSHLKRKQAVGYARVSAWL